MHVQCQTHAHTHANLHEIYVHQIGSAHRAAASSHLCICICSLRRSTSGGILARAAAVVMPVVLKIYYMVYMYVWTICKRSENGYKMKCDVRFTCLHTNCSKLVLHFSVFVAHLSLSLAFSLSSFDSYTNAHICVPDVCGIGWTHTHTHRCSPIYGFKIFRSKMLELMSNDAHTHTQT